MKEVHKSPRVFRGCPDLKFFKPALRLITICLLIPTTLGCQSILEQTEQEPTPAEGGKIVFASEKDGNFDIYTMTIDGTEKIRLTEHEAADFDPAWSPDGKRIAFVSLRDGVGRLEWPSSCSDDNCEIYVMDADGSNVRPLTHSENLSENNPVWSQDGQYIAFISRSLQGRDSILCIMNAEGLDLLQLTENGSYVYEPAWSPDGTRIAFRCDGCEDESEGMNDDIYVVDVRSRELRRLTTHEADDYHPAWSPDGRKVFFVSDRKDYSGIYVVDVNGTNERHLVTTTYGDYNMMNVSYWTTFQIAPQGDRIVYTSDETGYWQIFSMDVDGSMIKQLTDRTYGAGFPLWSPDGRDILFLSVGWGLEYEIYVMDEEGGSIMKLTTGSDVSWSP
jgi:TolB protein